MCVWCITIDTLDEYLLSLHKLWSRLLRWIYVSLLFWGFITNTTLHPHSWVVILASTLWQPLLPVGGPACMHDTDYDDWIPEPKGALIVAIICIRPMAVFWDEHLGFFYFLLFSKVWRGCTAAAGCTACWVLAFSPVTSLQKKLMLKCSPLSWYPSTR